MQPILLLVVAAVLIVIVIYVTKTYWKQGAVEDGAPMPQGKRRVLILYLVIFGSSLVFMLVSLSSLDFPATPVIPLPASSPTPTPTQTSATTTAAVTATPSPTASPATAPTATTTSTATTALPPTTAPSTAPVLLRIIPYLKGETTITPRLALYGSNFSEKATVRFNMQKVSSEYVGSSLIIVPMEAEYIAGRGSIMVEVVNGDAVSNAIPLPIEKPKVRMNVFFVYRYWITREIQLLLLVIFAGALGSYLHAVMSLTEFIAGRKLIASWFWWYMTRPFLGMAMGLVFYAVLRGGFLAGTPADASVVNPFGVLAIGALVGMFSDKAAQKLAEIFDVVFRSAGERTDKLASDLPLIREMKPDPIIAGQTEPVTVTISGEHLGTVSSVLVNKVDRKPESVSETEIVFKLIPDEIAKAGDIKIIAVSPNGSSLPSVLKVSEPEVPGNG